MAYDRINVRGIIREGNSLFLVKSKNRDYWSLPGGGLDKGEKAQLCLKRELYEELGVDAVIGDLLFSQEFYNEYFDANILDLFFEVVVDEGFKSGCHHNGTHGFELQQSEWVSINDDLYIKPKFLIDELLNPTGKIFFSEL